MKFVGHTMATPDLEITKAIEFFQKIGLDAIEIVVQEGTKFSITDGATKVESIRKKSEILKDGIVTLTPYYWDINSMDRTKAEENIKGLKDVIMLAKKMGARFVRSYGGKENAGGTVEENWANTVEALKEVGRFAEKHGICILVENHPGTMTRTGEATYRLICEVGCNSVKALYDPANVMYDTDEDWEYTLDVQKDVIGYVHVKDYYMDGSTRKACVVGEGIVPWDKIMKKLTFDGYFSFEYEKRWYPEQLEDAETGLKKSMDYLKGMIR